MAIVSRPRAIIAAAMLVSVVIPLLKAEVIWTEGEKPSRSTMVRHPWWYERVNREELSGGDFIAHFNDDNAGDGEAEYPVTATAAGQYQLHLRANPIQSSMSLRINQGPWQKIDMEHGVSESTNIADDGNPDLRFIAWIDAGRMQLAAGANTITFRADSKRNHHGYIDCFVLANEPFTPMGTLKPDRQAQIAAIVRQQEKGWLPFAPNTDPFKPGSAIDLRDLNERFAGEHGFIRAQGSQFILGDTAQPVRFWGVNGPPNELSGEPLRQAARLMARYGINLARIHGALYDESGNIKPEEIQRRIRTVRALKEQGIYSHLSIYFPLWLQPKPGTPWLAGYDGSKHPYATLYFNKDFQKQYQKWWETLLLTPDEQGNRLIDDPAVMGAELVNEDSYFFWTFNEQNLPDVQLQIIEKQFGDWLASKYGSIDAAMARWEGLRLKRDDPAKGRIAFRFLYNIFTDKSVRDRDTVCFLAESQRRFYQEHMEFLRSLGFKGLITASNWNTGSAPILGPIEKWTYSPGDFFDRHGYFGNYINGDYGAWSVRDGQTYADRSALRFDGERPGGAKSFAHPVMDICYDNKPSVISETTWTRPNRYRSEAPLFFAAYGALQDSSAIMHCAIDGPTWAVKPNFFMQPWTLMSPAMMGQFPAAALIYRKGLVSTAPVLADVRLPLADMLDLKGTPLPQEANFDELRLKDVPKGADLKPGNVIDPLIHYAGRTRVSFVAKPGTSTIADLSKLIDRKAGIVSSATGQIRLNYGTGLLTVNAPSAQAVSGMLRYAGKVRAGILSVSSDMELGHIIAVSLDGQPLEKSAKILLQVMSEERTTNFQVRPVSDNVRKIISIGQDPWMFQELKGTVTLQRPDAATLKYQPLDLNGYPAGQPTPGPTLKLLPDTLYYLVSP